MYRATLIGCGKIGSEFADDPCVAGIYSHAGAYVACPHTTLVAVCDRDPEKLERCGERWNVTTRYLDAHQMLAEQQPEIVSICTPDSTHYDLICAAIATSSVRAILAEKPLSLDLREAQEIVRLASKRNLVLLVNYSRRYSQGHNRLREFIKSGSIGEIQTVGGYYTKGILHNGTHWLDLARFLVGEVTRVWGHDVRKEGGDDPTLDAFLEFDNGANAYLHGCDAGAFTLFEMDLVGKDGRVRIVESGHAFEIYEVGHSPHYRGYRTLVQKEKLLDGLQNVLLNAVEELVRCLDEGGQPSCSGVEGIEALRIALAVRESARTGQMLSMRQS
jgi:predicted dehydrogenase